MVQSDHFLGDLKKILQELSQPAKLTDMPRRISLCTQALEMIDPAGQPQLWAVIKSELANNFAQNPQGKRADNLELAILNYQQALEVYTRQAYPEQWAATLNKLANTYRNRIRGERAENLEQAICYYQQALEVRTSQAYPEQWAITQNNLAIVHSERILGERAENIEQAIRHYQQALEIYTLQTYPEQWAAIQNNLANAYRKRIRGEHAENLEQAIYHFQQGLEVNTRQAYPEQWAMIQNNLALAYSDRIRSKRAENIEKAILHYKQALDVYTRQAYPEQWATTQNNLASAYRIRIRGKRANNLEQAIYHCKYALEVYTRQTFPQDWAMAQHNLATAYFYRIRGERAENLEQSIHHYQQALEVRTRQAYPADWAMTQNNLANAYVDRIQGERAANLELAIHHFQEALEVRTPQAYPEDWAMTQNNLANAYFYRIQGERAENLEQTIHHYRQALEVRTRQAYPEQWAMTQNNLANAYSERLRGERADNLEQAIDHFQQALEVYTRQAYPKDWAMSQHNLATTYRSRIRGDQTRNLEEAIDHYQQVLKVYTRQAYPEDWAMTQNNLANAYFYRIQGERAENFEQAIHHFQQALEVRTRQAYPEQWAMTQNNLANAYLYRIQGEHAENLGWAIHHYQQALEVRTPLTYPLGCRDTAKSLGGLAFRQGNWQVAWSGYQLVLDVQEMLLRGGTLRMNKEAELREVRGVPAQAAYALTRLGELPKALETLESGRARLLGEALERDRRDLELLASPEIARSDLLDRYREISEQYNALIQSTIEAGGEKIGAPIRPEDRRQQLESVQAELDGMINAIRLVPGYETFLLSPSAAQIQQQVQEGPLVYLVVTSAGGLALVATENDVYAVDLPNLTEDALRQQVSGDEGQATYVRTYLDWRADPNNDFKREAWKQALDQTTHWLWDALMQPLIGQLKAFLSSGSQVILISSDLLALLPLHAAWTPDATCPCGRLYAMDEYTFTYAPSTLALMHARTQAQDTPAEKLMMVENPDQSLSFSQQAAQAALELFSDPLHLLREAATFDAVRAAFTSHNVLYFFTHGVAHFDAPLQSALTLADQPLTLDNIFKLKTEHARLAVLAACETGVTSDLSLLDEVVSLSSGLMQAGVPGVVGSLWMVLESSTAILMAVFFEQWRKEGLTAPMALRKAQMIVRDALYNQEARNYFKESLPETTVFPPQVADILHKQMLINEFDHPFYWAAFTYTGL